MLMNRHWGQRDKKGSEAAVWYSLGVGPCVCRDTISLLWGRIGDPFRLGVPKIDTELRAKGWSRGRDHHNLPASVE